MNVLDTKGNFLGIPEVAHYAYERSACVIQQLPIEYSSTLGRGSKHGPEHLLAASHFVEYYDIELNAECYKNMGICTLEANDWKMDNPAQLMEAIATETSEHIANKKFVVSLGGEHSISYGLVKGFQKHYPEIGVLQIDAHSDLRDQYENSPWSHATVMRRIAEAQAEIFQVGIRAQSLDEANYMKSNPKIHCWYDKDIHSNDRWMDELVQLLPKRLYLSLDADGFDAEMAQKVGTPEPGGLGWYQTLRLLKKVFSHTEVVGFDIVELNPSSENDRTAYHMAQLCYKLIGYKFCLR